MTGLMTTEFRKDPYLQALSDLRNHLNQLSTPSPEKLLALCERLGYSARLQAKLEGVFQDTVDQLQIDIKYLQYDLETTRRERDKLREEFDALQREQGPF